MAGLSTLTSSMVTNFIAAPSNNLTGSVYNPVGTSVNISKRFSYGTSIANGMSGGADEVFSFQQGISAGASATLDLNAMTNLVQQTSVAIVRIVGYQFRLLSAADDATISPAPTAASTVTVTNIGPPTPAALDFVSAGSGLTVTLTVSSGAVTAVAIGAAGSGYPPSTAFLASPVQAGGSGCVFAVVTNASGVPTSVVFIAGAGGAGYTGATVPSVGVGQYTLETGGVHCYFDPVGAGFCAISSTQRKVMFYNNDASHAVTLEIDVIGATS